MKGIVIKETVMKQISSPVSHDVFEKFKNIPGEFYKDKITFLIEFYEKNKL